MSKVPGPNDVLIGHTTILEAARLISLPIPDPSKSWHPLFRFLELCSLTEAVVLHDSLFVLPAEPPKDEKELYLREQLLNKGILQEYSSPLLYNQVVPELAQWLNRSGHSSSLSGEWLNQAFFTPLIDCLIDPSNKGKYERARKTPDSTATDRALRLQEEESEDRPDWEILAILDGKWTDLNFPEVNRNFLGERGVLHFLASSLASGIIHRSHHAKEMALLRSMIYWQVADRIQMPWYPDISRLPWAIALNQRLRSSLSGQVYGVVAQAFSTTVEELLIEDLPQEAIIPPLAATLLSRCARRDDVVKELLTMRDEFADFRRAFRELEQQRGKATSIKEIRDFRAKRTSLLKAVASKYHEPDQSIIETMLGYAPDVLNPLTNPLDPTKYKGELLKKSYQWIRDWWNRRPASRLFSMTKKLENLKLYGRLVPQVFGMEITSDDVNFIRQYNSLMRSLVFPSGPSEAKTS